MRELLCRPRGAEPLRRAACPRVTPELLLCRLRGADPLGVSTWQAKAYRPPLDCVRREVNKAGAVSAQSLRWQGVARRAVEEAREAHGGQARSSHNLLKSKTELLSGARRDRLITLFMMHV